MSNSEKIKVQITAMALGKVKAMLQEIDVTLIPEDDSLAPHVLYAVCDKPKEYVDEFFSTLTGKDNFDYANENPNTLLDILHVFFVHTESVWNALLPVLRDGLDRKSVV